MSRRMFSHSFSIGIVGTLLFAATLKADPPQTEPAPPMPVVRDEAVPPTTKAALADRRQIHFDVKVWDVNHAALRALTKSELGVHEFYKSNGLLKQPEQPDWISAAIGNAVGSMLAPPRPKVVAPAPLPVKAFAVRKQPLEKTLLGLDVSSACKSLAEPEIVATNGREAVMLSGGEVPIFVPRTGDPEVAGWHEFGLKMKFLPRLLDNGRIAMGLDFENSELVDPKAETGDSSIRLIYSKGFRLAAQTKLGEYLLVAQQTGMQDVTRLVQIQPTLHSDQTVQRAPLPNSTKPVLSALPEKQPDSPEEFCVWERWPIGNVEVGNVVYPLVITNRTQLAASSSSVRERQTSSRPVEKTICRILAIDDMPDGPRRITLLPQGLSAAERTQLANDHRENGRHAISFAFLSAHAPNLRRFAQQFVTAIPVSLVPPPLEMFVGGKKYFPDGKPGLIEQTSGAIEHQIIDHEAFIVAKTPGHSSLTYCRTPSNAGFHVVKRDFLVKEIPTNRTTRLENGIDVTQISLEGNESPQNHPSAKIEIQSSGGRIKVTAAGPPAEVERAIDSAKSGLPVITQLRGAAIENTDEVRYQSAPDSTGERGGVSPPVERDRANDRGADAAPLVKSQVAEPQRVRPRKAARDVPSKSAELQQLRDEIRELRQDVRELIQRLDREQAAAATQPPVTPPTKTSLRTGEPWGPIPLAHESVIENAWQMLGLRFAPLTESERKQLPSKYLGGMRVTEVRPDSPASQNKIRKDDVLIGLHVWETTSFENLQFVLGHPHVVQHGVLKFYVLRGTETLFGELKIVTPAKPMPSNMRIEPPRQPRSIALADLPNKLVTEFDKLKLHIEVHRALIETALEARGITVTADEVSQFLKVHADRDQIPVALFQQAMQHTPMGQQFLQGARQQLALVKYSGQTTEPTEQELRDGYQLAQAGRVASQQISFADRAKADEVAREVRQSPQQFAEIAAKHGQANSFAGRTLIPTIPPNPQDEVLAKLKDGEVSDVIQVGDQFTIYQRQQLYKPPGTFEQLKAQLRATLILNKTNEIGQREVEQLRKAYRLIVVPVGTASANP